ncbi:MAG: hypothetical protein ABL958_04025 [Bdellovibrionia bacterium]
MNRFTRLVAALALVAAVAVPAPAQARPWGYLAYWWFGYAPSLWANLFSDYSPWGVVLEDASCARYSCEVIMP